MFKIRVNKVAKKSLEETLQSGHSMLKDSQTGTKLQHKLFCRFQYAHTNTIFTSKFHHVPTYGNLDFAATSLMQWDPELWLKHILSNISVTGIHFKQNFLLIVDMQIISNKTDLESVYLNIYRKVYLALQTGENYSSSGDLQNIFLTKINLPEAAKKHCS